MDCCSAVDPLVVGPALEAEVHRQAPLAWGQARLGLPESRDRPGRERRQELHLALPQSVRSALPPSLGPQVRPLRLVPLRRLPSLLQFSWPVLSLPEPLLLARLPRVLGRPFQDASLRALRLLPRRS